MDKVTQLGKKISKNRKSVTHALKLNTEIFPMIERARGTVHPNHDFNMEFEVYITENRVQMDVTFFIKDCGLGG